MEVRRQLVAEGAVAVRPLAEVGAVDPDLAIAVHAVEFDEHDLAAVSRGDGERLAIPAHATGQRAARYAGRVLLAELAFDAPVVGQVQRTPGGVVKCDVLGARYVAELEAPSGIELFGFALRGERTRD